MLFNFKSPPTIKTLLICIAIGISSLTTTQAFAKGNYHVEVVIFKHSGSQPSDQSAPISRIPSYANTWKMKNRYLSTSAKKIANSPDYQLISHQSWGQKSASYGSSAAKTLTQKGLNGFIKIYAKQLLLTEITLNYQGHLIKEKRRLKLNDVHYFDNAGFGVLMRVSRSEG